jgi:hypothetical protein
MSRVSSRSFAVNSDLQQQVELKSVVLGIGQSMPVSQATHDNLNCNANVQQGDADVSSSNKLYVQSNTAGDFKADANIQQGDADVGVSNKLHCQSTAADAFLVNANVQQLDADVSSSNKLHVQSDARANFATNANLQISGVDVSASNKVPVSLTGGGVSGSQGNLNSSSSVTSGSTSTAVNVNAGVHTIVGNTTDTSNDIEIQISEDNTNYYPMNYSIFPPSSGNFQATVDSPTKYLRLKYNGTATVTATVMSV